MGRDTRTASCVLALTCASLYLALRSVRPAARALKSLPALLFGAACARSRAEAAREGRRASAVPLVFATYAVGDLIMECSEAAPAFLDVGAACFACGHVALACWMMTAAGAGRLSRGRVRCAADVAYALLGCVAACAVALSARSLSSALLVPYCLALALLCRASLARASGLLRRGGGESARLRALATIFGTHALACSDAMIAAREMRDGSGGQSSERSQPRGAYEAAVMALYWCALASMCFGMQPG